MSYWALLDKGDLSLCSLWMEWTGTGFISCMLVKQRRTVFQEVFFKMKPVRAGKWSGLIPNDFWKTSDFSYLWGNQQWFAKLWGAEIHVKSLLRFCAIQLFLGLRPTLTPVDVWLLPFAVYFTLSSTHVSPASRLWMSPTITSQRFTALNLLTLTRAWSGSALSPLWRGEQSTELRVDVLLRFGPLNRPGHLGVWLGCGFKTFPQQSNQLAKVSSWHPSFSLIFDSL